MREFLPLSQFIQLRLSDAKEPEDVLAIWKDHREALEGYTFVLSHATRGNPLPWPAKVNWGDRGFLRSVFAHSNIWVVNDGILTEMFGGSGRVTFPADYSIAFDVNAASHLRAYAEGAKDEFIGVVGRALRDLAAHRFNWDLMPFFVERADDMDHGTPEARNGIWRAVYATEQFAASDQRLFAATGDLRCTIDQAELLARTQMQLAEWDRMQRAHRNELTEVHRVLYLMVLKAAVLEHQSPGPRTSGRKTAQFLNFLHADVGTIWLNMLWAAGSYFRAGGKFRPFSKLGCHGDKLLTAAANVAWDLHHLTMRRRYVGAIGRGGSLNIPYFLTFDRGLADLFDGFPQRSCLFHESLPFPQFFPDLDVKDWLLHTWPELATEIGQFFTVEAQAERWQRRQSRDSRSDELLAAELEATARQA